MLFRVDMDAQNWMDDIKALASVLRSGKRETDVLGYLGDNLIGLLLPHTDKEGAQKLATNVAGRAGSLRFSTVAGTYPDAVFERLTAEHQGFADTLPVLLDDSLDGRVFATFLKRVVDVLGALIGLLLLSPLLAVTAIAIATTSRGPVIFKQARIGRKGVPFVFYKFRSMSAGADDSIHREYVTNLIEGNHELINEGDSENPHYKLKADPRVTLVGEIIRSTSIDELPQLFNVLKGDMSLVGPRPPLPYEAEKYQSWHLRRVLEIRPGITGLWQVEGRSRTTFDEMVRLDIQYIRKWSPWLDIKILAKTVLVVLKRDGAN